MFEKKEIKNIKVTIRFSQSEKLEVNEFVEKNGFENISEFIRYLIKNELKK